jgi:hypothetical protein
MKKAIICSLLLAACASRKEIALKENTTPDTKWKIESIDVKLDKKCDVAGYPDQAAISKLFNEKVKEKFCKIKECTQAPKADDVGVAVSATYKRTFMGEGFFCRENPGFAIGSIIFSYDLSKNGVSFYHGDLPALAPNRGMFGNIGRIGTQLSSTGGVEEEADDIEYLTGGMAQIIADDKR